jgi:bacterial leucyl aminopeptidase
VKSSVPAAVCALAFASLSWSCASGDSDEEREPDRHELPAGDVWITIGEDALVPVEASLQAIGAASSFSVTEIHNGVAVARIRESRLGLVAEVMHDDFNRCAGFIQHVSHAEALAAANAAGQPTGTETAVAYTLDNAAVVQALLAEVQATQVRETIVTLSAFPTRHYTSATGVEAAHWLQDLWQGYAAGRPDVTVELFAHSWAQPSVILTIPGSTLPGEVVVLGGHLDSINSGGGNAPGADDDASGIASLSEVIRVALAAGYRPARTVKFMAYAAEEVGLRGSGDIATSHKNSGIDVVGVLQLDMTNYQGSDVDVGLLSDHTNAAQNAFVGNLIDTYLDLTWQSTQCGYACSDHASWTSKGFPASLPFEALMGEHNGAIHSANDTLATSGGTADHAAKFTRIAIAYMAELGKGTLGGAPPPPVEQPLSAVYDATLEAPRCATVGIGCDSGSLLNGRAALGPEVNKPSTINASCADGTSGRYHADESNDRLKVVTVDGSRLAPGKTVRVEATVWAYANPAADKLDLYYTANAASPSWTLIGTLTPPGPGAQTLTATYTLPTGASQAVRARFRYQGSAAACGTGAYDDHDDLIFAVGGSAPNDTTAPSVTLTGPAAGSTVSGTATLTANATDAVGVSGVDFFVDGVRKGSDASSPYSYAWDTTTASNGAHVLQAKASDAAGNQGTSASASVTVANAPPAGAVYDAALEAPRCSAVGSVCDSGSLLSGRGTVGNEPNRPNTIHGSCADGTSGTFHADESNDKIRISTLDGTSFAPGKTVKIEATVWAYSTASADRLDLYYTANAASPTWTFLTTLTPPGSGARTLSATYPLPAGNLQAVRARFRYQGSAAACGAGSYTDHDDLIFAVQ